MAASERIFTLLDTQVEIKTSGVVSKGSARPGSVSLARANPTPEFDAAKRPPRS